MNIKKSSQFAARFYLNKVTSREIVEWAMECMQEGVDSTALSVVASYTQIEFSRDVRSFSDDVLKLFDELGVTLESDFEASDVYARYLCEGIIDGSLRSKQAHNELYELWSDSFYDPKTGNERLSPFMYLCDAMELLEMGECSTIKSLTKENYIDHLKQECEKYLLG